MNTAKKRRRPRFKSILFGIIILAIIGAGAVWYVSNEKFRDTGEVKAEFTVNALDLIHELKKTTAWPIRNMPIK